jgi:hypothetical protein
LATLCAHHLDTVTKCKPFCFTFNSPRVGNLAFVRDFRDKIARQKEGLESEVGVGRHFRAFAFFRGWDKAATAAKHGVSTAVPQEMADVQWTQPPSWEEGLEPYLKTGPTIGVIRQGGEIGGNSPTAIYYHIQNRVKMAYQPIWDAHDFNLVEEELLGVSVSDGQ